MKRGTALLLKAVQLSNFKQNRIFEFSTKELCVSTETFKPSSKFPVYFGKSGCVLRRQLSLQCVRIISYVTHRFGLSTSVVFLESRTKMHSFLERIIALYNGFEMIYFSNCLPILTSFSQLLTEIRTN